MKKIARREGIDDSYVSRMINLITLAPDIVAVILDESSPPEVTLFELAAGTPVVWEEQGGGLKGSDEPRSPYSRRVSSASPPVESDAPVSTTGSGFDPRTSRREC